MSRWRAPPPRWSAACATLLSELDVDAPYFTARVRCDIASQMPTSSTNPGDSLQLTDEENVRLSNVAAILQQLAKQRSPIRDEDALAFAERAQIIVKVDGGYALTRRGAALASLMAVSQYPAPAVVFDALTMTAWLQAGLDRGWFYRDRKGNPVHDDAMVLFVRARLRGDISLADS